VRRGDWAKGDEVIDLVTQSQRVTNPGVQKRYTTSIRQAWDDPKTRRRALATAVVAAFERAQAEAAGAATPDPAAARGVVTARDVRAALYSAEGELQIFRPVRAAGLLGALLFGDVGRGRPTPLRAFAGKRWLDPCAGWGDRLWVARVLGLEYLGFDPNLALVPAHAALREAPGVPAPPGAGALRVVPRPFEDCAAEVAAFAPYDLAHTSPPYFDLEIYAAPGAPGYKDQSIVRYRGFAAWGARFLIRLVHQAWGGLREGGTLAINLSDTRGAHSVELLILAVSAFFPDAHWRGTLLFTGRDRDEDPAATYCWFRRAEGARPALAPGAALALLREHFPEVLEVLGSDLCPWWDRQ
jgi:hypothetical protein